MNFKIEGKLSAHLTRETFLNTKIIRRPFEQYSKSEHSALLNTDNGTKNISLEDLILAGVGTVVQY